MRSHRPEIGEALVVVQLRVQAAALGLGLVALAHVADDGVEEGFIAHHGFRHRELDGKDLAAPPLRLDLADATDRLGNARGAVAADVSVVLVAVGRRHQQPDVLPEHLVRSVPEHALRAGIEERDLAARRDADDGVLRRVEDRLPACGHEAEGAQRVGVPGRHGRSFRYHRKIGVLNRRWPAPRRRTLSSREFPDARSTDVVSDVRRPRRSPTSTHGAPTTSHVRAFRRLPSPPARTSAQGRSRRTVAYGVLLPAPCARRSPQPGCVARANTAVPLVMSASSIAPDARRLSSARHPRSRARPRRVWIIPLGAIILRRAAARIHGGLLAPAQLRLAERAVGSGDGRVAAAVGAARVSRGRNDLHTDTSPALRVPARARTRAHLPRLALGGGDDLRLRAAGRNFGELAAFTSQPRESYARAVRSSLVWRLHREAIHEVLAAHPGTAIAVTKQVGSRLKRIESRVEHLVFRSVPSRVAGILVELAEDFGRREAHGLVIDLGISQEELATLVGASRQAVNASLRELEHKGLVRREGRWLVLLDVDALRRSKDGARGP